MSADQLPTPSDNSPDERTRWERIRFVLKVIEVRLRFVLILVITGLAIVYWDTIKNVWTTRFRPAGAVAKANAHSEYFCPMHPTVIRASLEQDGSVPQCPICGMPLSLRKKGEKVQLPAGVTARVQLSPDRVQMAGIKTASIGYRPIAREITTVGNVTFDEQGLSQVTSRVSGYVEKLYVDKTFAKVKAGDPLAEVYSPELYSAARELLLAVKHNPRGDLVESGMRKLRFLGVDDREIDKIIKSADASTRLTLRSPRTGHVIRKDVVEGSRIDAGTTLLEVADLSTVWIEAEVFEKDISMLREGQPITATVDALPGKTFSGKVALVHPHLETVTRTNRVRFELENKGHELRPGMFATVHIASPAIQPAIQTIDSDIKPRPLVAPDGQPEVLAVPESAVVDSGSRKVVYVESEPGVFDGKEVELGPRVGDFYSVIKGLRPGDRVAAAGAFLVDAETRLKPGAASTYFGAIGSSQAGAATPNTEQPAASEPPAEGASSKRELTPDELKNLDALSPADRKLALAQRICPISNDLLGSMGVPVKITLGDRTVFLCCKGCLPKAQKDPEGTLGKLPPVKQP